MNPFENFSDGAAEWLIAIVCGCTTFASIALAVLFMVAVFGG